MPGPETNESFSGNMSCVLSILNAFFTKSLAQYLVLKDYLLSQDVLRAVIWLQVIIFQGRS